jgi:hypothetical protein
MGFLQMATASVGSFVVALLPYDTPFGMIAVFGGFVAAGLGFAIVAVRLSAHGSQPAPATAPVAAGDGNWREERA